MNMPSSIAIVPVFSYGFSGNSKQALIFLVFHFSRGLIGIINVSKLKIILLLSVLQWSSSWAVFRCYRDYRVLLWRELLILLLLNAMVSFNWSSFFFATVTSFKFVLAYFLICQIWCHFNIIYSLLYLGL